MHREKAWSRNIILESSIWLLTDQISGFASWGHWMFINSFWNLFSSVQMKFWLNWKLENGAIKAFKSCKMYLTIKLNLFDCVTDISCISQIIKFLSWIEKSYTDTYTAKKNLFSLSHIQSHEVCLTADAHLNFVKHFYFFSDVSIFLVRCFNFLSQFQEYQSLDKSNWDLS